MNYPIKILGPYFWMVEWLRLEPFIGVVETEVKNSYFANIPKLAK